MSSRWDLVWRSADVWGRIGLILLIIATVVQTCFVLTYATRRSWFLHPVGRALMLKSGVLALTLWVTVLNTLFIYPDQEQVGTIIFFFLTCAIVYQFAVLISTSRRVQ